MTLVLSEISQFGVAMAADSAVTFGSGRVYIGAQKLLRVPQIDAGLSVWGMGKVGDDDADVWLQDFIKTRIPEGISLWDMATKLAGQLNQAFGEVAPKRMGIHVAGFDKKNDIRGPALYHIHNGHYHVKFNEGKIEEMPEEDPPIREFRAHADFPPSVFKDGDPPKMLRNGAFGVFALYQVASTSSDRF